MVHCNSIGLAMGVALLLLLPGLGAQAGPPQPRKWSIVAHRVLLTEAAERDG